MKQNKTRIAILAGGTGGHIYPALAVAQALQARGFLVSWIGSQHGLEQTIIGKTTIPFYSLKLNPIRGKGLLRKISVLFNLPGTLFKARTLLKNIHPQLLIGFGGFASGPTALTGKLMGIPLIIHEQNAKPGLTNRILKKFANRVCCAFPGTFPDDKKIIITGNPLRPGFNTIAKENSLYQPHNPLHILVMGGSRGAHFLNTKISHALCTLPSEQRPKIWHQTGPNDVQITQQYYHKHDLNAKVEAYIENSLEAYQWADLVIARSGALTVSELMAINRPAILIPYPYAVDDHQWHNAQFLTKNNKALCWREHDYSPDKFINVLQSWQKNLDSLRSMAKSTQTPSSIDATETVVSCIIDTLPHDD